MASSASISPAWGIAVVNANVPCSSISFAAPIIAQGGHVSIGLGDYTYHELGQPTNAELVRRIAQIARDLGREVASPDEAKAILGMR